MRKRRGTTLIEILVTSFISLLVLGLIGQSSSLVSAQSRSMVSTSDRSEQSRSAISRIVRDIRLADRSLTRFPTIGSAAYTASDNGTLILRKPVFDADGVPVAGKFDVDVYKTETPADAADGPFQLVLIKCSIDGSTQITDISKRVLAKKIQRFQMASLTSETFYGNRTKKSFDLVTTPAGSNALATQRVLVAGVDRITDNTAMIVGSRVVFPLAPNTAVPIDVIYRVNPSVVADAEKGNFASQIYVEIELYSTVKRANYYTANHNEFIRAGANLGNN